MQLGPLHFNGDVNLGSIITIAGIVWSWFRYFRHFITDIKTRNERLDKLWLKFNGPDGEETKGFFSRFDKAERRINEVWERLQFNRINIDETKSRIGDTQ